MKDRYNNPKKSKLSDVACDICTNKPSYCLVKATAYCMKCWQRKKAAEELR